MDNGNDDGLWDELSHQQSREIAQHELRHQSQQHRNHPHLHRIGSHNNPAQSNPAAAVVGTAAAELGRFAQVVYGAGQAAYQTSERRRKQAEAHAAELTDRRRSQNHNRYLDDFGIPKEEPLLDRQPEHNAYSDSDHPYAGLLGGNDGAAPSAGNDFVFLPTFRRSQGWGNVSNLDVFFKSLYSYYYHRGLVPIVGKGVVELVTMFGTLILSVFMSVYIDWKSLASCIDENSCHASLSDYVVAQPFVRWTVWNAIVTLYVLLFLAYAVFSSWTFLHTVRTALDSKFIFEEKLGISARKLEGGAVEWETVVAKLVELQTSGTYRVAVRDQDLDALGIANRILRKENFMVALVNRGLLDLTVPFVKNQMVFCPSLEWSMYFCVLNFMFNHKYQIRPAFYLDASSLRRRFLVCGIAHLVFLPFLIFFMTLHFVLHNAYDWKSTEQYLGPHEWSLLAKWTFREFNELPHHFERRLAPSYSAAEGYLKLFGQNELVVAVGRILVFFGGGLGTVLVAFAALNDAILLHVKIADWNLLWYAGVVGVIYTIGKSLLPTIDAQPKSSRNLFAEIEAALGNIAKHTHHYPDSWRGKGWRQSTHQTISSMYKFKAQLFVVEIASIIMAPYVLCVSLVKCAGPICEFVLATKTELANAGEVCGYATFDFDQFQDDVWEGRTIGNEEPIVGSLTESVLRTGNVEAARRNFPKPKAMHGKMEKSFFSFKSSHPSWICPQSGQSLIDRVEQYQRAETVAFGREQQAHIEAAARQLETLAKLEKKRLESQSNDQTNGLGLQDSYIGRQEATADAGAGSSPPLPPPQPQQQSPQQHTQQQPQQPEHMTANPDRRGTSADPPDASNLPFAAHDPLPRQRSYASLASGGPGSTMQPSMALSSELRRILNMSTLDPDVSIGGSFFTNDFSDENIERRTERQYMWLERYHNHIASQQQQQLQPHPQQIQPQQTSPPFQNPTSFQAREPPSDHDGHFGHE